MRVGVLLSEVQGFRKRMVPTIDLLFPEGFRGRIVLARTDNVPDPTRSWYVPVGEDMTARVGVPLAVDQYLILPFAGEKPLRWCDDASVDYGVALYRLPALETEGRNEAGYYCGTVEAARRAYRR